ncbi:MAG TPA: DUF1206 domain-containing protein [Pyrinomonadaceae bacterium]|nr:DUF1206 domain-containing protein [Pyrinomonadaceae bacterium]
MKENITQGVQHRSVGANPKAFGKACQQLAVNNWVRRMAQLGYAAKGLLYVIVGGTAVMAVLSMGRRVRGTGGALNFLLTSPFGRLGVAFIALGLFGFVLRRFIQIFVSPTVGRPAGPLKRVSRRIGYAFSGLGHLGIALTALELALGLRSSSGGSSMKMRMPLLQASELLGVSLIRLAGLAIVGFAIFQFYLAISRRFEVDLRTEDMSYEVKRVTYGFGIAGHVGRGVAFLISGGVLVYAGWFAADIETGGLTQTLRTFQSAPFGIWIFFAVAAGLAAFGIYLVLAALHLRLIAKW